MRILIVDDSYRWRDLLRRAIASCGHEVVAEAQDGREAVLVAQDTQPDLIVLDLSMPVMNGAGALPELRRVCPLARVIVFSAATQELAPDERRLAWVVLAKNQMTDLLRLLRSEEAKDGEDADPEVRGSVNRVAQD